jgi:phosphoenolpyruvate synthase/pyruvate phosphate dikinase
VSTGQTRTLAELRSADEPQFGGKSAGLGELIAAGAPVPPGFALASGAYVDAVEGLEGELTAEAVGGVLLSESLRAELAQRYEQLAATAGGGEPPVAVRSSAIGEDSADASFAGLQETILWVRGVESLCESVRACWASLFSPEAISYRAEHPAAKATAAMGVTVQRMVDAESSGVMFTCNPVTGDPSTVAIEGSWGLGLAVVGGEATPDTYRLSKVTGEVLERTVGAKEVEYAPDPSGAGTVQTDVPAERRTAACLDEEQLGLLLELARRIEGHFGSHQDIEFAFAREGGELFALQSRPVTVAPAAAKSSPPRGSAIDLVMGTFGASGGAAERD